MDEEQKITLSEDDLYEKLEMQEEIRALVVFRISGEWYGIDMAKVREVIKVEKMTYLPSALPHIAGIVSLRGNILSVTNLKNVFGLPEEEMTAKSKLVVVKSGILETGLWVDEVIEPTEVPVSKIDPALATISREQADFIEGQCKIGGRLIGILKIEKILEKQD